MSSPVPAPSVWLHRQPSWPEPGRGPKKGILFKNSEALEKATKLDVIVLDKTGTITLGKPFVVDLVLLSPKVRSEERFLMLTASAGKGIGAPPRPGHSGRS